MYMINVILLLLLVDKLTAIAIILSVDCLHKKQEKKFISILLIMWGVGWIMYVYDVAASARPLPA